MNKLKSSRGGFGIATMFAVMIPALILVVALAHSFQASTTRRITSAAYSSYLCGEITESAIAEAAHLMSVRHMFANVTNEADFTNQFIGQLLADQAPGVASQDDRSYWNIIGDDGSVMQKMLVGLRFDPSARGQEIPLKGIAKEAAELNPGIKVPEMKVTVRPISFRREYLKAQNTWVNWGIVAFRAHVEIDDGSGPEEHGQVALKLFTLRPSGQAGDVVMFSDRNLRTFVHHPHHHRRS